MSGRWKRLLGQSCGLRLIHFSCANFSVPDAPASLTVFEVFSDALRVSWRRPAQINGLLIAYIVKHWQNHSLPSSGNTERLANTTLSHTVTGLRATTLYSVEVSAETRAGVGTSSMLVAMTTSSPGAS